MLTQHGGQEQLAEPAGQSAPEHAAPEGALQLPAGGRHSDEGNCICDGGGEYPPRRREGSVLGRWGRLVCCVLVKRREAEAGELCQSTVS